MSKCPRWERDYWIAMRRALISNFTTAERFKSDNRSPICGRRRNNNYNRGAVQIQ